jgi:hypothetical protein
MSYDQVMATSEPSARELIDKVLADARAADGEIAEHQRLKVESERALERLHQAVAELADAQTELMGERRAPASSR